jgi:hypothetical protein
MQDELPTAIGKVVMNFQTVELILKSFLSRLISEDKKISAIVTTELSFKGLVHAFSSLILYKFPEQIEEAKGLILKLEECELNRNKIVHSSYMAEVNQPQLILKRIKITSKQKKGLHTETDNDVYTTVKGAIQLSHDTLLELREFHLRLFPNEKISYV